jgi:uncharacterized protein (DUF1501 family)
MRSQEYWGLNMKILTRRDFLKYSATYSSGAMIPHAIWPAAFSGISQFALGATTLNSGFQSTHPLIVVFQRGGADGLGILSPLDDPDFIAARPPEMRHKKNGAALEVAGTPFYWHPEAELLGQLFTGQDLSAWLAVGISKDTRSHFEAQELIESGLAKIVARKWRDRQVSSESQDRYLGKDLIFAGSNSLPQAFLGLSGAMAMRDLQSGMPIAGGASTVDSLKAMLQFDLGNPATQQIKSVLANIDFVNQALGGSSKKIEAYQTAGLAPYPTSDPGVGLRSVARLMAAKVSLPFAWVDQDGWDTHEGQPWRLNGLLRNLGQALTAFSQDMKARNQPYTLVVLTEFGRRLRSNQSNGTDHGHGSLALLMGSHIQGGRVEGIWPGLKASQLNHGADLAVTTQIDAVIRTLV